jgi:hypothetical protein
LLIQIFGLAGYLPLVGFGIWGMRLITKRAVVAPLWRTLALLLAAIAAGVTLSALPNFSNWPLFNGMGGAVGSLVFSRSIAVLGAAGVSFPELHLSITMAIIAFVLWIFGIGMTRKEWGALARAIGFGASALSTGMKNARTTVRATPVWQQSWPKLNRANQNKSGITNGAALGVKVQFGDDLDETPDKGHSSTRTGLVVPRKPKPKPDRKSMAARQGTLALEPSDIYTPPPHDLLEAPAASEKSVAHNKDTLEQNAKFLGTVLGDFGIKGKIVKVRPGPV